MWLEALSTNKMPSTVAQLFLDRILEYGGRYESTLLHIMRLHVRCNEILRYKSNLGQ